MRTPPCHYCHRDTVKSRPGKQRPQNEYTRDHVVPRVLGGRHDTVPCCLRCNSVKSDGSYDEFVTFAATLLRGRKVDPREAAIMWRAWQIRALL